MSVALFLTACSKDDAVVATPTAPIITSADGDKNFPSSGSLNQSDFAVGSVAIPTAGENKMFDHSKIVLTSPYAIPFGKLSNTDFASATSTISGMSGFINNDQTTPTVYYYGSTATSLSFLGTKFDAATLNYPGVGSVAFLAQNVVNTPAFKMAEFPMMYNASFNQTTTATTNLTVDSPALPAPNIPGKYVDVNTSTSANIAWGTLKIPGYSSEMKVLVQKVSESVKRNYFLMNANGGFDPMPAMLLQAVSLTDGAISTSVYYRYWVAGKGYVMVVNENGSGYVVNNL